MAEEMEDGEEEETKGRGPSPPPPLPPSPRNRLLSVPASTKNPVRLPGLSNCHSCGLHFPSKLQNGDLRTLESQWRIVLLCNGCLRLVRSAEACSYCFSRISEGDGGLLDCRDCSRRVHLSCAPLERGCVALSELHPNSFICVDCCALPGSHGRGPSVGSRVSLEDLVRNASSAAEKKAAAAARAKEKAVRKVGVARHAVERARNALDSLAAVRNPTSNGDRVLPDEELALQLHRAMNGSQRNLRNPRHTNLDHSTGSKKLQGSGNSTDIKAESRSYDICRKIKICTESKAFFESIEETRLYHSPSIQSDEKNQQDIDRCTITDLSEIPVEEEEHGSCSNKVVNSGEGDSGTYSISMSCQRPNTSNATVVLPEYGRFAEGDSSKKQSSFSLIDLDKQNQEKDMNGSIGSGLVDIPVKEEHGICSNKGVNYGGDDNSIGSIFVSCRRPNASNATVVLPKCGQVAREGLSEKQWKKRRSSIESDKKNQDEDILGCSGSGLIEVPVKEEWESCSGRGAGEGPSEKHQKKKHSSIVLDKKNQDEDINRCSGSNLVEVPVKEEWGSFSINVVNSGGNGNSIDAISTSCQRPNASDVAVVLSECGRGPGEDPFEKQCKKRRSSIELDKMDQESIDGCCGSSLVEIHVKEEWRSSSYKVVHSGRYDNSISSISSSCQRANASNFTMGLSECGRGVGEDFSERPWKKRCSSIESGTENQNKDIDACGGSNLVEIPVKEEWGCCSSRAVNSCGDDNCIGSISTCCQRSNASTVAVILPECGRGAGKDSFKRQRRRRCFPIELDKKNQKKSIDGRRGSSLVEIPGKVERGTFSIQVVNYGRDESSIRAISTSCQRPNESNVTVVTVALSECGQDAGEDSSEKQWKKRCGTSDCIRK